MKKITTVSPLIRLLILAGVVLSVPFTHILTAQAMLLAGRVEQADQAPEIDVWYGLSQTFGHLGWPQDRINILGNVSAPADAQVFLQMRLNGGSWLDVRVGTQNPPISSDRLESRGDFNIELFDSGYHSQIDYVPRPGEILRDGVNQLELRAGLDGQTWPSAETITIHYTEMAGPGWPQHYDVDWSDAGQINAVAQVVDGDWRITSGGYARTNIPGYDRLIAIGDMQWDDYEVETSFIVHELVQESQGGIGLILGWQGHIRSGSSLPLDGWHRIGVYGYYSFRYDNSLMLRTGQNAPPIGPQRQLRDLNLGEVYRIKLRVETDPENSANSYYAIKMWPAGASEPEAWDLGLFLEENDQRVAGSVLLVAHEVDASFGNVRVRPLGENQPPDCYTLTALSSAGGQVSVNPAPGDDGCYPDGTRVTLTAEPDSGYRFVHWDGDVEIGSSVDPVLTLTMDANKTVQASFAPAQQDCFELTVDQSSGGQIRVDPVASCYPPGSLVRLQAVPQQGYLFSHWTGDLAPASGLIVELQIDGPRTVGAVFIPVQSQLFLPLLSK